MSPKKMYRFIFMFIDKLAKAHIGAYAAQAAYFTVLSYMEEVMPKESDDGGTGNVSLDTLADIEGLLSERRQET